MAERATFNRVAVGSSPTFGVFFASLHTKPPPTRGLQSHLKELEFLGLFFVPQLIPSSFPLVYDGIIDIGAGV